ncbi:hypothetical protein LQV63_28165 [Paenibacillus profundus]|uniref:Uncharacterized protein n=1 Tax=Paenibacillus profundus TaxID=1173085 RepID=A0ABS8YPE8_9BACL|nr:hypothetical protein [Paenibacillus profundus]MCE5173142.1 hypothetical protein [Paenibacillus profundus]
MNNGISQKYQGVMRDLLQQHKGTGKRIELITEKGAYTMQAVDIIDKKTSEIKTRRYYGPDEKAVRDADYTNHGNSKQHPEWPHEHIFQWNNDGSFKRIP